MISAGYSAYLASSGWRARRAAYFAAHSKVCAACAKQTGVDLHHMTYERLGVEPDSDFMPLCRRCHDAVHHAQRQSKRELRAVTLRYVKTHSLVPRRRRPRVHAGAGVRPPRYKPSAKITRTRSALAVANAALLEKQRLLHSAA